MPQGPMKMSARSRSILASDLERHGHQLEGLTREQVADLLGERTGHNNASERARRLHAWYLRHGTASPVAAGLAPPAPASAPAPTMVSRPGPDDLTISRWDQPDRAPVRNDFDRVARPEDGDEPVEVLIGRREAAHAEAARRWSASRGPRQIRMPPGPYAVAHFGDPHLDDDGCDWPALLRAVRVVSGTPGFYGGNIGDLVNNWAPGRLAELYGQQSSTIDEGWRLARWLMQSLPWLYVVLGNHDTWRQGGTILRLLADGSRVGLMAPDEVRLELLSPGTAQTHRMWCRHNFKGQSIWNQAHGPMRASKLDPWADVHVAGHLHEWVTHCEEGPDHRVRWAIRTRGFKRMDSYATQGQFHEHKWGEVVTTVVDPTHDHPYERVRVHLDVEEAAEHLTWLRRRRGV